MANNNGFADMGDYLGTLAQVDPTKLSLESLTSAANFYREQLLPKIPKSLLKKKHMADQVKVIIEDDQVQVAFEGTAFTGDLLKMEQRIKKPSILLVVRLNKIKIRLKKS